MSNPLALIIEDHENTAMIFSAALQTAGFETEIISDGRVAQERLADLTPAIVILDLHLPYVSGGDLLNQIRQDERLSDVRVVLATADPLLAENLSAKSDLVLIKPISFDQLSLLSKRLRPKTQ